MKSRDESPSTDAETTIDALRALVEQFVVERDWHRFHSPKNLSMALAIEAAELMEHFQWIDAAESRGVAQDKARLKDVGEELADVLCYELALANELGLDVATTVRSKMLKNAEKYPAAEFHGRYGRNDPGRHENREGEGT